jgi:hypothetical protein
MEVMDEIILASDVIMVARGDLGVEIGDANLPAAQKQLIRRARQLNRAVKLLQNQHLWLQSFVYHQYLFLLMPLQINRHLSICVF